MEFDNVCTIIQGYLRSLQKSVTIKLIDVGHDDDDVVTKICETMENVAKELQLDSASTKKVHMLILVNTKWEHMGYFEEDKNFCHMLNCLPPMSRYLYFKLVSNMGWHNYLGEVILHFPEFLVREILTYLDGDLKYLHSKCAVPFLYSILSTIFHKIMYLQEHCKRKVTEFVKVFTSIMKFNFEGIINEMDCSAEKKAQYWGYTYRMFLDLINFSIDHLNQFNIVEDEDYIYSCEYNYDVWPQSKIESCRGRLCLGIIANKCIDISDKISVNTYMAWTELDLMEDGVEKTLQMCVRESAFKARQSISNISELHNSVAGLKILEKRLREIELKPITEEDEIATANADTILMNLFNPKRTQSKWLKGLINIGIFESAPHMKVVSDNARLIDVDSMTQLLNSAVRYLSNNSIPDEDHDVIRNTLISCLKALKIDVQLEVLSRFSKTYPLMTPLICPTFYERTTLLFNKIVNDNENKDEMYSEMIWLAIENAEELFRRAFNECLASRQKASLIMDLVHVIAPSADVLSPQTELPLTLTHLLTILGSVKEASSEKLKNDFLHLIEVACELKVFNPETLMYNHIMALLENSITGAVSDVNFYLDIISVLEPICKPRKFQYIVLLIKIVNRFRPKINNFTMTHVEVVTKAIELLEYTMDAVDSNIESIKRLKWLADKTPPLTALYLTPVLCSNDKEFQEAYQPPYWILRGLGHGKEVVDLKPQERAGLVTSTLKILPSLTMKEWERIGGGTTADFDQTLYTFFVLVDSLLVLIQVPAVLQNPNCFGNVITNFIHYTKTNLVPKLKSKKGAFSIENVKEKIELLSTVLPEDLDETKRLQFQHFEQTLAELKSVKRAMNGNSGSESKKCEN